MSKRRIAVIAAAAAVVGSGLTLRFGPLGTSDAAGATPCTDPSSACVTAAAGKYINALVTHHAADVPLAANAYRTENGMVTGTSGAAIRNDLETNAGDKAISGVRDVRWFVAGDVATAFYLMDTTAPNQPTAPHTTTVHLAERFKVDKGLIRQIEAVFWISPGLTPDGSGWPPPAGEG
jgi:hypothetical protein